MKIVKFLIVFSFVLRVSLFASNQENLMLETFDIIKNIFKTQYAPMEWKKEQYGWDLDNEIEKAKQQVRFEAQNQTLTVKSYQKIVKNFFNSPKDYHVGVSFYSTEMAFLPFKIKSAEGRYFIIWLNSKKMPNTIAIGDELIEFDGLPIQEALTNFKNEELILSNKETDNALAEFHFCSRIGSSGHLVPQGSATIKVKSKSTHNLSEHSIPWAYHPEKIISRSLKSSDETAFGYFKTLNQPFELASWPSLKIAQDMQNEKNHYGIGTRDSFIPTLGKITWESKDTSFFHAYLFEANKKKIAYVRIPSFSFGENEIKEFSEFIKFAEKRSCFLIIDQMNNPGGNVHCLYEIVSMFINKPLAVLNNKCCLTQKDIMNVLEDLAKLKSDTEFNEKLKTDYTLQSFTKWSNIIVNAWNRGLRKITAPIGFIDTVYPHPTCRYTKPILILINGLDFSCGDYFPLIMKDANRATLFGSRTAGAGGAVMSTEFPNLLGIGKIRYTGTITERDEKTLIENIGVEPDIAYTLTVEDLQNNFLPLKNAILNAIK